MLMSTPPRWMPQNSADNKPTLVQAMAWCHQATSHYPGQCLSRFMSPYDVTKPQRIQLDNNGPIFMLSCYNNFLHDGIIVIIKMVVTLTMPNKANLRDLIAATGLLISNWIQIVNFSAHVTVKFDGWPCKTIGHLFYATSSFVHLFVPIGEFKLKLQSWNAQSGSNWMIFRAVRPWNLTDDLAKQ